MAIRCKTRFPDGNQMQNTVSCLKAYFETLKTKNELVPNGYKELLSTMDFLQHPPADSGEVFNKLANMAIGESILLPGGWKTHAMVYQFTRRHNPQNNQEEFVFSVINSGAGLGYHAQKSGPDKELFNPRKSWVFPRPKTLQEGRELLLFIKRLRKAKGPHATRANNVTPMDEIGLYEEVFPSIAYLGGEEIDANQGLPKHAWTGSQISPTCSMRALHQLLKINTAKEEHYQRFIFGFKQYALETFVERCRRGAEPFNEEVALRINEGIANNLRILNIPNLFSLGEKERYVKQLTDVIPNEVRELLNSGALSHFVWDERGVPDSVVDFSFQGGATAEKPPLVGDGASTLPVWETIDLPREQHYDHQKTRSIITQIQRITNPALRYHHLQQLILSLPVQGMTQPFYAQVLKTKVELQLFQKTLDDIQEILSSLKKDWLQDSENPSHDVMVLSLMVLQSDVYEAYTKQEKLPSFLGFETEMLEVLLKRQSRNPYLATNNPQLDDRLQALRHRFNGDTAKNNVLTYNRYLLQLLKSVTDEVTLRHLASKYYDRCAHRVSESFQKSIQTQGLEALYAILTIGWCRESLPKADAAMALHSRHELQMRRLLNHFVRDKEPEFSDFAIRDRHEPFCFYAALRVPYQCIEHCSTMISKYKYNLAAGGAEQALKVNLLEYGSGKLEDPNLNRIQVIYSPKDQPFHHLRSIPELQIQLTLAYFSKRRHLAKLNEEANQRFVEANLFQPSLLGDILENEEACQQFIRQFDKFEAKYRDYFYAQGLHNKNLLFSIRLHFLLNRYLAFSGHEEGLKRLKRASQEWQLSQLPAKVSPEYRYVTAQYLFLTLMTRIDCGEDPQTLFQAAYQAYFYLQNHMNPHLQEDHCHRLEMESHFARFQVIIAKIPTDYVEKVLIEILRTEVAEGDSLQGQFPKYHWDNQTGTSFQADALQGKIFQNGFAKSSLPYALQHHPLLTNSRSHSCSRSRGLTAGLTAGPSKNIAGSSNNAMPNITNCFTNEDASYFVLNQGDAQLRLFYRNDKLIVQKEWLVNGQKRFYELQSLSTQHAAYLANKDKTKLAKFKLPKPLVDGSMDYWQSVDDDSEGLLVQDEQPMYVISGGVLKAYTPNSRGLTAGPSSKIAGYTGSRGQAAGIRGNHTHWLAPTTNQDQKTLNTFEASDFLITQASLKERRILLPRYGLSFVRQNQSTTFTLEETGEWVDTITPMPIHPSVAGLVLRPKDKKQKQARVLVPVARFYAKDKPGTDPCALFPIVQDTSGHIADECLKKLFPGVNPLWQYQHSETCVSFRLIDGKLLAESPADTLYLAYLYLCSNQTEKAWQVLDACAHLNGTAVELQYLTGICTELPHILPSATEAERKAERTSSPYIACQLKAMSMLCKHLLQEKGFEAPVSLAKEGTANAAYAKEQQTNQQQFLQALPGILQTKIDLALRLERHREGIYALKDTETRCLSTYFKKHSDTEPQGAMGLLFLDLELKKLSQKRAAMSQDREGQQAIDQLFQELKAVKDKRKDLQLVDHGALVNKIWDITDGSDGGGDYRMISGRSQHSEPRLTFNIAALPRSFKEEWPQWRNRQANNIKTPPKVLEDALHLLSSEMNGDDFMERFFLLLEIAIDGSAGARKQLYDFCRRKFTAMRHLSSSKLSDTIPFLCQVLYRVLNNPDHFKEYLKGDMQQSGQVPDIRGLFWITSRYGWSLPPLQVYEVKDHPQMVLQRPEQNMASPLLEQSCIANTALIEAAVLGAKDETELQWLFEEYRDLEKAAKQELAGLAQPCIEEAAGKILFNLEQNQREFAAGLNASMLKMKSEHSAKALATEGEVAWAKAMALADKGPDNAAAAMALYIDKASKKRAPLTRASLKALYLKADAANTMHVTGLSEQDARTLHQTIHDALVLGIRQQSLEMATKALKKFEKKNAVRAPNTPSIRLDLVSQALDLMSKEIIPGLSEPAVLLLQHEEKLLLRPRQEQAIAALLAEGKNRFAELIEKIIMGGGKSKVLLPILAEKKARGNNLVVIEVPEALLPTNFAELSRTSKNLFGKEAVRFEFNRDSNSSSQRLKAIYQQFTDVMTDRGYLVTTGVSVQSLELKYLELLLLPEEKRTDDWAEQIYWCDKIVGLLRHHGDCLIDEVHQGLWINKKLNYTIGEPKDLNPLIFKNAIALYGLLDQNIIREAQGFKDDHDWTDFKAQLIDKLLAGPLKKLATRGLVADMILRAYLSNQADELPMLALSPEDKSTLAYFKEQVNVLLPHTLMRRLDEHYGASKLKGLSPNAYTLAIPYIANNVPNESSRFGNELEAINYSIQMMLLKGISFELLKEKISAWQLSAHEEFLKNKTLKSLDETEHGARFKTMARPLGLSLSQIYLDDNDIMSQLHHLLKHDSSLIFEILKEKSLPQIRYEQMVIHSDAYNHADSYHSVQGISGTPDNHLTYHQRLSYNANNSLGTDAYVLEVLKAKNTSITGIDYQNVTQFVAACLGRNARTRALIDIAAFFKGVSNLQVAEEIAATFRARQDSKDPKQTDLKHVLYFNDEQQLCALSIDKPGVIIRLASSDLKELNQTLGSKPEQRFTYYDQVHTLGTDIAQAEDAHALVLADDKLSLSAFLQGSMRMRKLNQGQTAELIVPTTLANTSLDKLVAGYKLSDKQHALNDAPLAAKGMMDNIGRHQGLTHILDLPSDKPEEKARAAACFKDFFVDTPSTNLAKLYGGLSRPKRVDDILKAHKNQVISKWQDGLGGAGIEVTEGMKTEMAGKLQVAITRLRPHCRNEYETKGGFTDEAVHVQKQTEKQTEKQTQQHLQTLAQKLHAVASADVYPKEYAPWPEEPLGVLSHPHHFEPLNKVCGTNFFSQSLVVSNNYIKTYHRETYDFSISNTPVLDVFIKPVFCIWYQQVGEELHAMVITQVEAKELGRKLPPNNWIATTDDEKLYGSMPDKILQNREYLSLREQVRFFSGELDLLVDQETPLDWLKTDTLEKMAFFRKSLMPFRPDSELDFPDLEKVLAEMPKEALQENIFRFFGRNDERAVEVLPFLQSHSEQLPSP